MSNEETMKRISNTNLDILKNNRKIVDFGTPCFTASNNSQ
jgi:hypothetical protein